MKPEDFYSLNIGQQIYYKGGLKTIEHLMDFTGRLIGFYRREDLAWDDICADCSLEAPKAKRKVTLYRYTYHYDSSYFSTGWQSQSWDIYKKDFCYPLGSELVLTESKTIEVDV
ncbi:hypothetical protein HGB07_09650 [Candidatus Roizmanbacteria bacterium]|nr:hypothetical protein [Candidatus Roizmanbacteria bacterium]